MINRRKCSGNLSQPTHARAGALTLLCQHGGRDDCVMSAAAVTEAPLHFCYLPRWMASTAARLTITSSARAQSRAAAAAALTSHASAIMPPPPPATSVAAAPEPPPAAKDTPPPAMGDRPTVLHLWSVVLVKGEGGGEMAGWGQYSWTGTVLA
jgi:hypothetical protein